MGRRRHQVLYGVGVVAGQCQNHLTGTDTAEINARGYHLLGTAAALPQGPVRLAAEMTIPQLLQLGVTSYKIWGERADGSLYRTRRTTNYAKSILQFIRLGA